MGFLNDFINSSGIIFEFHYNFIIFFLRLGSTILYKKFQFFFTPYTPQKMTILAKFGHFGTFWYFLDFFLPPITPKKNQKMTILTKFGHFGTSWHFSDFFYPLYPQKTQKMTILAKFGHFGTFLALFWGGVKIAQKKIMLFKYSPLARQNSKNFYTHCFLIISQIILTGTGLSYQRVLGNLLHLLFRTEFQELTVHDISGLKFPKGDAIIHCI